MRLAAVCLAAAVFAPATPASAATPEAPAGAQARFDDRALRFRSASGKEQVVPIEAMQAECGAREVEVEDPYHGRRMRYAALPLACVLALGFADSGGAEGQRDRGLLLRALDGYTRPVAGRELLEVGAYLAFGEPSRLARRAAGEAVSAFSPIDRRQVDPAPFYLVWVGSNENDPHDRPWPYQLSRIDVAPFEEAFPRTVPSGLEETDPGWEGYALFQTACASCHSINGQGGKVGPELNVPRSIVEYRPIPQIRAYILNPAATRYTSMPPHPGFSDRDLDALIAYFRAMSRRKQDPYTGGDS